MTIAGAPAKVKKRAGVEGRVIAAAQLGSQEASAWEEIRAASPTLSSPFFSCRFTRAVAAVRPHVYVCVLRRESRIIGFLPFQFRNALYRILRSAERVAEEMSDYFGLIVEPGFRTDAEELLRWANLNSLNFSHLDQSQFEYGLKGEKPETGLQLNLTEQSNYWEQIRKADKKFGSETQRLERQVRRDHGEFRFVFDEPDWQPALDGLIERKGEQYQRTGRRNLFTTTWRARLLRNLAETRELGCAGVLSTLYAGESWIASHFGLRSRETLQYWFPVYNAAMKRYAPGRLLFKQIMQHAPEMGIQVIDRGGGDNYAKRQLSNREHLYYRGLWSRPGLLALTGRAALAASWRFDGRPVAAAAVDTENKA